MSQNLKDLETYREPGSNPQWLELFKGKPQKPPKKLWEQVKEMEECILSQPEEVDSKITELGEFRATAIVNFGPKGRHTPGLVTEKQSATQMLISIVEKFLTPTQEEKK